MLLSKVLIFYNRFMQRMSVGRILGQARRLRLRQHKKLNQMITAVILAFVLSWSPYCFLSLISNFTGRHVTTPEFSLVPQLMAKMSVVYNPLIVTYFNRSFRTTLLRLMQTFMSCVAPVICCHRRTMIEEF